ncbi:polygalacturonase/glycoside hydrolase family protein [Medicago truncatula]|uniref:Polygalacturonase/glycoside hydrolase family protein n=1 Tax=Medicago truncatula TaxID=3880 RepID=G7KW36_MEDTR|nr:polygalacturonase/glycoside hydrolase family protein [Medicago truncatula]
MLSSTTNVRISNVFCGFCHEISVGSLGKYESEQDLDDIIVTNCTFSGTSIDVRIKSWKSQLK